MSAPTPSLSLDQTLRLSDGRQLGYAEFGDPRGAPVVFLHGWCGSRLSRHPDDALTASLGVRLITVDRPGVGLSDRLQCRRLLDWPDDLRQLADALGLNRFGLLGHSGGGPHALACGVQLADRLTALGIASSFAPMERPRATDGMLPHMRRAVPLLGRFPWMAGPMLRSLPAAYRRDAEAAWEAQFGRGLPASDRQALDEPGIRDNILSAAIEALRTGSDGIADELPLLMGRRSSFSPTDVRVPTLLCYGQADVVTPIQMERQLSSAIPQAELVEFPDEGHMVCITHWAEILRRLGGGQSR
jgi:pimeloyl-ACP methyl ester carboxylesterase